MKQTINDYTLVILRTDGKHGKTQNMHCDKQIAEARLENWYHCLPQFCDISEVASVQLFQAGQEQPIAELEY